MALVEPDKPRFVQRVEQTKARAHTMIDARRGLTTEVALSTIYLINAYADTLIADHGMKAPYPVINRNVNFQLPQKTELEIVRQEDTDGTIYRNIFYTAPNQLHFSYRSVEKDGETNATMKSTTSGERGIFQIEGRNLLKIMKGITHSKERREQVSKVIDIFKRERLKKPHESANAA